jgi:hypothetical protein
MGFITNATSSGSELTAMEKAVDDTPPPAQTSGNMVLAAAAADLMVVIGEIQQEMSTLSSQITTMQSDYATSIQNTLTQLLNTLNADTQAAQGMSGDDLTRITAKINTDNANYNAESATGQQIQKAVDSIVQVTQGFLSQLPTGEQQFVQFMQTVIQGMSFIAGLISR